MLAEPAAKGLRPWKSQEGKLEVEEPPPDLYSSSAAVEAVAVAAACTMPTAVVAAVLAAGTMLMAVVEAAVAATIMSTTLAVSAVSSVVMAVAVAACSQQKWSWTPRQ